MIKKFLKFRIVSSLFLVNALFVLSGSIWSYAALHRADGPIIIHLNNLAGINQIGNVYDLLWVGITGFVMVIVNMLIALELEARDAFWGKLLAAATLLTSILLFIGFAAIIGVN